jgi:hypothetical protein
MNRIDAYHGGAGAKRDTLDRPAEAYIIVSIFSLGCSLSACSGIYRAL